MHPLPYCPEFFLDEFKSKVADMKNSVKDRGNAQSRCLAGSEGPFGPWLGGHIVSRRCCCSTVAVTEGTYYSSVAYRGSFLFLAY